MQTILLIGQDATLLHLRTVVLERLPSKIIARNSRETRDLPLENVDLVILCHTLDLRTRSLIIQETRRRSKSAIMQLESYGTSASPAEVDAFVKAEPRILVAEVRTILAKRNFLPQVQQEREKDDDGTI